MEALFGICITLIGLWIYFAHEVWLPRQWDAIDKNFKRLQKRIEALEEKLSDGRTKL